MSFWFIPDDLLPGPAFEESRDALSPLPGRMARSRRHLSRTLGALSPKDSLMSHLLQDLHRFKESYDARAYAAGQRYRQRVEEFFQPIVIRWRQRKLCFSCGEKATRKCRTHGSKLCDSAFCRMEHRRIKSAVSGSLLRPFCEFPEPTSWQTHLLRTAVALAVGLAVMAVVAL